MLSDKFVNRKDTIGNASRPRSVEQEFARQRMFKRMQAEIEELQPLSHKKADKKSRKSGSPGQTSSSPDKSSQSPNKESFFHGNRNISNDKKVSLPEILSS